MIFKQYFSLVVHPAVVTKVVHQPTSTAKAKAYM